MSQIFGATGCSGWAPVDGGVMTPDTMFGGIGLPHPQPHQPPHHGGVGAVMVQYCPYAITELLHEHPS